MTAKATMLAVAAVLLSAAVARADMTLSNGPLTVDIRTDNGAINRVLFGGSDYYNPGIPVSNWGVQAGTVTATYVNNTTAGGTGLNVTVAGDGSSVTVTGAYTVGGADVDITRRYSLVAGWDVLRVTTTFVNAGPEVTLRYFDTLDPDQGVDQGRGSGTYNDVFNLQTQLGMGRVAQATEPGGLSVVMGSLQGSVIVASGNPLSIRDGGQLNALFDLPYDGDGQFEDNGAHVAVPVDLPAGATVRFVYDQAYGPTPQGARGAFKGANIPAPPAALLGGIGLSSAGLIAARRLRPARKRRRRAPPG